MGVCGACVWDWRECHDFSWVDPKQSKFAVKCFWEQNHSKSHFHLEQVKLRSLEGTSYLSLPKCKYMNALKMKNCSTGKLILWDGFLDNHVTMIIILKAESFLYISKNIWWLGTLTCILVAHSPCVLVLSIRYFYVKASNFWINTPGSE
jgi:hypothetical protein